MSYIIHQIIASNNASTTIAVITNKPSQAPQALQTQTLQTQTRCNAWYNSHRDCVHILLRACTRIPYGNYHIIARCEEVHIYIYIYKCWYIWMHIYVWINICMNKYIHIHIKRERELVYTLAVHYAFQRFVIMLLMSNSKQSLGLYIRRNSRYEVA